MHRQGRLREAEKLYARVLKAAPDNFDALHLLGLVKAQSKQMGEAYRLMSAALKINPQVGDAWSNLANVLHALKRDAEALDCLDKALALNPGDLQALQHRGSALLSLGRPQEALECFAQVTLHGPPNVEALHSRGVAKAMLGRHAEALADFDAALALAPLHPEILYNRGNALASLGREADALASFDRALAAAPHHVKAWNNRGRALQALNRHAEAVDSFGKAIALQKDYADAHSNRALSLLTLGELAEGFAEYEWRWKRSGMSDTRRSYRGQLWLGEYPLGKRTILLHAEQGLGDTIQFARYAPFLARAGATVRLEVHPPLKTLLAGLDGIASCDARGETISAYDVHCPLGSLPLALKTTPASIPADIPYLHADEQHIAKWRAIIEALPGKRVALAWAGNRNHPNDRNRSLDPALLEPLLALDGYFIRRHPARVTRIRRRLACAASARHPNWRPSHGHVGYSSRAGALRSHHRGRYRGGAPRRRHGTSGLGLAAIFAGLALDAVRRPQPLVSASAAFSSARARRLAQRDR